MKRKTWFIVAPVIVVLLGMVGFVIGEGYGLYKALLSSFKLLTVYLEPLPHNYLLEIARWIGILFLFGIVYTALISIIENSRIWRKTRKDDTVAIHGDDVYVDILLDSLGNKGIHTKSKMSLNAKTQVIMYKNDDDALDFYQKNIDKLSIAKEVHLCLDLSSNVNNSSGNTFIVNISEVKAISYWREYYVASKQTIVIIGSGKLAEAVLYWGLLTNVYDVDCGSDYLVYGNYARFVAQHGDINNMLQLFGNDHISINNENWFNDVDALKNADRIILCGSTKENIDNALALVDIGVTSDIHLFSDSIETTSLIGLDNCICVGTISNTNIERMILMDDVHKAGKLCHAAYMIGEKNDNSLMNKKTVGKYIETKEFRQGYYKNDQIDKKNKVDGWDDLDAFTLGSNYAAAIHDPIKRDLLVNENIDVANLTYIENSECYQGLSKSTRDRLQEIEHIRWCRYHLMHNWKKPKCEIIIEGETRSKDPKQRLHTALVPYSELSEENKERDAYFYKTLSIRL